MKRSFVINFLCVVTTWNFWLIGSACIHTKSIVVDPIKNEETFKELFRRWENDCFGDNVKMVLSATYESNRDRISTVCFSLDGTKILSNGKDAELWNLKGNRLAMLGGPNGVDSAIFSSNSKHLLTTSRNDGSVQLWDTTGACLETFTNEGTMATFSPDGERILISSRFGGEAKLYDLHGQCRARLKDCMMSDRLRPTFNSEGTMILTAGNATAKLWNLKGKCLVSISGHTSSVVPPILNAAGTRILTVGDTSAKLWDLQKNCLASLRGHSDFIMVATFNPDQSKILTGSRDKTAKLWDVHGTCLETLTGHSGPVKVALFSPDGGKILTIAEGDTVLFLWNGQGKSCTALADHEVEICSATFSPDGSLILSVSRDGKVMLSNCDGVCLERISLNGQSFTASAVFNNNATQCVTAFDHMIKLWDIVTPFNELKRWLSKHQVDADAILFDREPLQKKIDRALADVADRKRWLAVAELLQQHRTHSEAVFKRLYELWIHDDAVFNDLETWFKKYPFDVDKTCDEYFVLALEKLLVSNLQKGLRIAHLVQEFRTKKEAVFVTLFQLYRDTGSDCVLDYMEDWHAVYPVDVGQVYCGRQTYGEVIDRQNDMRIMRIFNRMPLSNSSCSIPSNLRLRATETIQPPHVSELLLEIEQTTKDVILFAEQVVLFSKHTHWLDIPYEEQVIINGQLIMMGEWFDALDGKDICQRKLKSGYYERGGKS